MSATMTSWSSAILTAKSILHTVHLQHRDFHKRFYSESFTSKWWLSSKVETWNLTKYKLFKLANSMKMVFIFRLKSEHSCSEKERKTNARLLDDALKIRGVKC